MKKYLLLSTIFFLIVSQLSIFAQDIPQRGIVVESPPPPFEPNKAQLNLFLSDFEDLLTCRETFDEKEDCFFTEKEINDYISFLISEGYPRITHEATPMFLGMVKDAKAHLKGMAHGVSHIELHRTKQRFGKVEAQKVVIPYINVHYHDGNISGLRLTLMEHENAYKIMNIDN